MKAKKNESELLVEFWEHRDKLERKRTWLEKAVGDALEVNLGHNFDCLTRYCKTCGICLGDYYSEYKPYYTRLLYGGGRNPKIDPRSMFCTSLKGKELKYLFYPAEEIDDRKLEKYLASITHM